SPKAIYRRTAAVAILSSVTGCSTTSVESLVSRRLYEDSPKAIYRRTAAVAILSSVTDMLGHTPSSSLVAPLNHAYLCMDVTEHTIRPQIISFSDDRLKDGFKIVVNQRSTFSSRTAGDSCARLVTNSKESLANPGVTTPPAEDVSCIDLGNCDQKCHYCGCLFWYAEWLKGAKYEGQPEYHLCCRGGKFYMPQAPVPPLFIRKLLKNIHFIEHIRAYNQMVAMTSFGAKFDDSVNKGRGPYVFKVSRQICHWIGSLCPEEGYDPRLFRTAQDRCSVGDILGMKIRLYSKGGIRGYELLSSDLLEGIVFEDGPKSRMDFDVIIQLRGEMVLKPKDGSGQGNKVSMNAYYKYHLHIQAKDFGLIFRYGLLFQQYVVTVFCAIEQYRLDWVRKNQKELLSDYLMGLYDAVSRGDQEGIQAGSMVMLPRTFTGGPRFSMDN
nr:helitron helicase-like domain-containing protein [Tanacetum cinerariifolium]